MVPWWSQFLPALAEADVASVLPMPYNTSAWLQDVAARLAENNRAYSVPPKQKE